MSQAFVPGLTVTPQCTIQKVRELPIRGEVLVRVGDFVKAEDVVAQASLPGDLHIVRVAEKLGIEPQEAIQGLKIALRQSVAAGDVVCVHRGFFGLLQSTCSTPFGGVVEFITEGSGHVGIRGVARPIGVDAYISGRVVAVDAGKSVTIESSAAMVQGVFGIGGERHGVLTMLNVPCDKRLTVEDIPTECRGTILVGGMDPTLEAIQAASERGCKGLVTGSVDDHALRGYLGYDLGVALTGDESVPMSIVITEGFGAIPLAQRIFEVLSKFAGRNASLSGATQVRAGALRPEVLVCHQSTSVVQGGRSEVRGGLHLGSQVRLIRVPYFGQVGKVTDLPHQAQLLPSGAYARVVKVLLASGEEVIAPRANVELVEG